jgi:pyrimidine operon attenuation protein/uracil phosphoribosyltransferase
MSPDKQILLDKEDLARAVARMAHEAIEKAGEAKDLALIGIRSRGIHLARRLARKIEEFAMTAPSVGIIDVTPYRDDRPAEENSSMLGASTEVFVPVESRTVVLVDDVIYRGRTVRAALEAIEKLGRPKRVLLAVLIDRGARELPIRADIVGKNVEALDSQKVSVQLEERDGIDRVMLIPWEAGGAR